MYAMALRIDQKCPKSKKLYEDPYDAFVNKGGKNLCLIINKKVVFVYPIKDISLLWALACIEHVLPQTEELITAFNLIKNDPCSDNISSFNRLCQANHGLDLLCEAVSYMSVVSISKITEYSMSFYASQAASFSAQFSTTHGMLKQEEIQWQRNSLKTIIRPFLNKFVQKYMKLLDKIIIYDMANIIVSYLF